MLELVAVDACSKSQSETGTFPLPKLKFITVQIILELCSRLQNLTLGGAQLESMVLSVSEK